MAARVGRSRITWALLSGAEQADIGFYWLSPSGATLTDLQNQITAEIDNFWQSIDNFYKPTTIMTRVRVDEINVNTGRVISGQDAGLPAAPYGATNAAQLPLQCAPVVTLRTPFSGPSFRGRVYMPPMVTTTIDTLGYLDTTPQQGLANGVADFLTAVNGGGTDWVAAVYSRKNQGLTPISSVDVGKVFDTMRARRSDLVEARYTAVV